jgi:acetyl-CoA acetyltransferase
MKRGSALGAIAGLGMTEMSREPIGTAPALAARAIMLACEDAGLAKPDIDGLLINTGLSGAGVPLRLQLQSAMGLTDLKLLNHMDAAGSTAGQMVQYASLAIQAGICSTVACVFADAPLQAPGQASGAVYGGARAQAQRTGFTSLEIHYGLLSANAAYALAARRHMGLYGTTSDHLGAVAVSNRKWAAMNPAAIYRKPLTLADYHASRWVCEPFHVLDCTLVNNGAVAVIVTSPGRAKDLRQPPVNVLGMGQAHPGNPRRAGFENEVETGARVSGKTAFSMAGVGPGDVDICQLYDCYTYTTLVSLEDYGFCKKGEGGDFVSGGRIEPGGALPTNTGGGQLSAYYMWGMTPLSEAVIQARGQAGERQAPKRDIVLVSTQGGILDYHSTLILSPHASTG